MSGHNVAHLLRRHALAAPDSPALVFPAAGYTTAAPAWDTWTYRTLDEESDRYARGFVAAGVRPGDRAAVLVPPSLQLYALLFGLFKAGAVPVLVDRGMGVRALLACLAHARPRVVVAVPAVHALRTTVARSAFPAAEVHVTVGRRWWWGGTTAAASRVDGPTFELVGRAASDPAAILFTSGSTGPAKGVISTQAMFAAQAAALRTMFDLGPGRVDLQCFAAFALFDVSLGLTSVVPHMDLSRPASVDPADLVAALRRFEPDVAFGSPVVWRRLSRHCLDHGIRLPSLSTALTVGAPIPPVLHARMRQLLPERGQLFTPYGATEAMPISSIGTAEVLGDSAHETVAGRGTCVGRPSPGATVRIVPITDDPFPAWPGDVAPGTIGEIVVAGDQVSGAYADDDRANALSKIPDGDRVWHRMGDLGRLDDCGRLWFCGRKSQRLVLADGEMLAADAVEAVFDVHPDVGRTALVGLGPRGAQTAVLCVEMEPGRTLTPEVERALMKLGYDAGLGTRVSRIFPHPGLPTDARHNSKIRREEVAVWAAARAGAA